jgi:two-component system cell cycle sensor histidine kinase/response regulator CckA
MNTSILIVEDEALIALDLKERLEQAGYRVPLIADTVEDAIEGVELHRPSLVLMDIRLRGSRDGIEAADQIRRRFHLPVMFVTSHADQATLERAKMAEPFGYIVKPFHGVDFRAQIEIALWKHLMEQKLRVSEAWLSTTFRNVADALIATDSDGHVAFMNAPASDLTGWGWKEAKGRPFLDVFQVFEETTGLPVLHPLNAIYDGLELGSEARIFSLKRRDGSGSVLVEAELSANSDQGTVLGIIVVFRDVTARRKAEQQNCQLQKMNSLTLMAVGLGRELAASQNQIDRSLKDLISRSRGTRLGELATIYVRVGHQHSVIQQLITLGKTQAGQPVSIDVNAFLNELSGILRKTLGIGRTLHLTLEPGLPPIKGDLQDFRDNLLRLVVDARHAMPDGGTVDISTKTIQSGSGVPCVEVAIRDTGKVTRAGVRDRVFDPYYQSRPGITNPGFSLALVYQFVALSGGSIELESAPGEGVGYLLSFPAMENGPPEPDVKHMLAFA